MSVRKIASLLRTSSLNPVTWRAVAPVDVCSALRTIHSSPRTSRRAPGAKVCWGREAVRGEGRAMETTRRCAGRRAGRGDVRVKGARRGEAARWAAERCPRGPRRGEPTWQSSKGTRGVEGGGGIPWETPQRSKFRVPFVVDAQVLQHRGHDAFVVVEAADVEVALAILRDDEVADGCVGELALTGGEGVPAAQQELALLPEGARAFEIHELAHAVLLEEPAHVRLDLPAQLAPLGDGLGDQLVEALPELRRDPLQRQGSAYAGRRRRGRCGDGWRGGGRRRGGLGRR